jgi:ketosteroid isomerase-like protein
MTSMMETNKNVSARDIVLAYFTALQQRDLPAVVSLFADVVDWDVPGHQGLAPWLGKRNTREEIEAFFNLLWCNTEAISGSIDHLLVDGNVALTSGRFASRMLPTGKVYESMFFTEITVNNGLIIKYRLLEEGYGLVLALTA